MKTANMAIENFNKTFGIWMSGLESLTLNQLLVKPDDRSWSLGQVYGHLVEETNWYNGQIIISLDDIEHANIPMTIKAQNFFKNGSFPNERILGDPLIAENVKQPISVNKLKSDLKEMKSCTNKIWDKMKQASSYGKSEHPGMGYLNCFEWLQYSEMHMRHHLRQKDRIEDFLHSKLEMCKKLDYR